MFEHFKILQIHRIWYQVIIIHTQARTWRKAWCRRTPQVRETSLAYCNL